MARERDEHGGASAGAGPRTDVEDEVARLLEADAELRGSLLLDLSERAPARARAVRERLELLERLGFSTDPCQPLADDRVGAYRLIARIGRGGMGDVHLAEDEGGARVAVKLLRPEHLWFEGARARFEREIQAVSRLAHAGIVPLVDHGEQDGVPWLALRYVAGASLASVLAELAGRDCRRLSRADFLDALGACARRAGVADVPAPDAFPGSSYPALVAGLAARVAHALEHAHERGVLHRDVKPSNVLVTPSGEVLLADFGLALPQGTGRMTRTGSWLGSLPYAAPEQLDGRGRELDVRADVYSLGVTLYELLTLRTPFLGGGEGDVRRRIVDGSLERLARVNPGVGRALAAVCERALDRDPAQRYASAADLAQDLERVAADRPVAARPLPAWLRARRWIGRHGRSAAAAALLALVVASSLAIALREHAYRTRISRLSDASLVRRLTSEAEGLWPMGAGTLPAVERWLAAADGLRARRDEHERALARLRAHAQPYDASERAADRAGALERLSLLTLELEGLAGFVAHGQPTAVVMPPAPERVHAAWERAHDDLVRVPELALAELQQRIDGLRATMSAAPALWLPDLDQLGSFERVLAEEGERLLVRRTWSFADPIDRWQHDELERLAAELEAFETLHARVSSLRARLLVRMVALATGTGESDWSRARREIAAAPVYGEIALDELVGLEPLGFDPASGLYEFLVSGSGERPARAPSDEDPGRLALDETTGIVLVLLPGGRLSMGNRPGEEQGRGGVPQHEVSLEPFLLSKFELSVGQAERLGGFSRASGPPGDRRLPVALDWETAHALLARHALVLPTEAQWEFAARGGRDGPGWTTLEGRANVRDLSYDAANAERGCKPSGAFDDGFVGPAPVGSFLPTAFGLYDVFGNLEEWCLDWSIGRGYSTLPSRPRDGLKGTVLQGQLHATRGGSHGDPAQECHAGRLVVRTPFALTKLTGVRPARALGRTGSNP